MIKAAWETFEEAIILWHVDGAHLPLAGWLVRRGWAWHGAPGMHQALGRGQEDIFS